jgi:phage-related protein (TIGR01555 family)
MQRYALAGQMKSLVNMMLLDGDSETLERNQLTFSGLGEILDKLMIWVSGAADIPMTRLFGQGAAGLNATGEGDMRNYYDAVGSMQEAQFRPDLEQLDEVMVRSALGEMPDDAMWRWEPLYQESGTELAQQDLAQAQTDDIRLQQGVVKPSHVMKRLQGDDKYALTDEDVERAERIEREDAEGFADPDDD